jgi:hypothetical protein
MSIDRDEISREAREILRLADHFERNPHLVSERVKQIAEDIRAAADVLEREHQKKTEALNMAVRQVPKIWRQWLRRL